MGLPPNITPENCLARALITSLLEKHLLQFRTGSCKQSYNKENTLSIDIFPVPFWSFKRRERQTVNSQQAKLNS